MKKYIAFLLIIVVFSCNTRTSNDNDSNEEVVEVSMNDMSHIGTDDELIKKIRSSRDTFSYECLSTSAIEWGWDGAFVPYALFMANKWDYAPAYYDVYYNLFLLFDCEYSDISCFDKTTAVMALSYLLMAYEKYQDKDYLMEDIERHIQENYIIERNGKYFVNEDHINKTLN